jgi:hypothetical protein
MLLERVTAEVKTRAAQAVHEVPGPDRPGFANGDGLPVRGLGNDGVTALPRC